MSIVSRVVHALFAACYFVPFSNTASAAWADPPQTIPFLYNGVTYTHIQQVELNNPLMGKAL